MSTDTSFKTQERNFTEAFLKFTRNVETAAVTAAGKIVTLIKENDALEKKIWKKEKRLLSLSIISMMILSITSIVVPILVGIGIFMLLIINKSFLCNALHRIDNVALKNIVLISLKIGIATATGLIAHIMSLPIAGITYKMYLEIKK